jgi:L-threonylcarbamoyladenylate synthase
VIISQTIEAFPRVSQIVASGGVIAFRTDTFYGLGADPFNRDAIQRIKRLKGSYQPILIVISDQDQVTRFITEASQTFASLAEIFWPGPLTLIGKAAPGVPDEITAGTQTIGVRLPDDEDVRALVRAGGGALTATSANPSHREPARTAQDVSNYFSNGIDLIVDGGCATADQPSTVVDVSGDEPLLIREGLISWSRIQAEIHQARMDQPRIMRPTQKGKTI